MLAIETATDVEEHSKSLGRELTANDFEPANWEFIRYGRSLSGTDAIRFKNPP